jgi:hypothetical protein
MGAVGPGAAALKANLIVKFFFGLSPKKYD